MWWLPALALECRAGAYIGVFGSKPASQYPIWINRSLPEKRSIGPRKPENRTAKPETKNCPFVGFTENPPHCLFGKGEGHQNIRSHTRMLGPSVFPDSNSEGLARGRMLGPRPECLVLQYFQIHESYQNAWSFSIYRFTGPQNAWSFSISRFTSQKCSFEISKYTFLGICSKIRASGPSRSIRLVKSRIPRGPKVIHFLHKNTFFSHKK